MKTRKQHRKAIEAAWKPGGLVGYVPVGGDGHGFPPFYETPETALILYGDPAEHPIASKTQTIINRRLPEHAKLRELRAALDQARRENQFRRDPERRLQGALNAHYAERLRLGL